VTAVVLLGDIVERPTQRYLVTEVLNMWEVSMGGSHKGIGGRNNPSSGSVRPSANMRKNADADAQIILPAKTVGTY
jgi:hypothetical protein